MKTKTYFNNINKKAVKDIQKGGKWINTTAGLYFTDAKAYAAFLAPFFEMESQAGDVCRENDRQWTDGIARIFENITKQEKETPGETATITAGTMRNAEATKKVIMLKSEKYTQYIDSKVFYGIPDGATVKLYGDKTPAAVFYNEMLIAIYCPINPGENSYFTESQPEKKERKEPQSRRGEFWINTNPKPQKVTGFIFEAAGVLFGVHKNGDRKYSQWTITDIESGLSCGEKRTKAEAIKDAERIAEMIKKYRENPENSAFYTAQCEKMRKAKAEAGELDEERAKIDEISEETTASDKTTTEAEKEPKTGEILTDEVTEEAASCRENLPKASEANQETNTGEALPDGSDATGKASEASQETSGNTRTTSAASQAAAPDAAEQTEKQTEAATHTEPKTAPNSPETKRAEQIPANEENTREKAKTKPGKIRGSPNKKIHLYFQIEPRNPTAKIKTNTHFCPKSKRNLHGYIRLPHHYKNHLQRRKTWQHSL